MVTRIPAPPRPAAGLPREVLALLAQLLDDGTRGVDGAAAGLLDDRADRLLAALTTAGLLVDTRPVSRLAA